MSTLNEGVPSIGSLLQREITPGSNTFVTIGRVEDFDGPDLDNDMDDTTNHSSSGGYEEALPTVHRTGMVKFKVVHDPTDATHLGTTSMMADCKNRTRRAYKIIEPDDAATVHWQGNAYVKSCSRPHPVKGGLRTNVSLKVTGAPTSLN